MWPLAASLILFVPLLTPRSQQFHPWYWMWVLSWIPLCEHVRPTTSLDKVAKHLVRIWQSVCLGMTGILFMRYVPFLLTNQYSAGILQQQRQITWIGFAALLLLGLVWSFSTVSRYNTSK